MFKHRIFHKLLETTMESISNKLLPGCMLLGGKGGGPGGGPPAPACGPGAPAFGGMGIAGGIAGGIDPGGGTGGNTGGGMPARKQVVIYFSTITKCPAVSGIF